MSCISTKSEKNKIRNTEIKHVFIPLSIEVFCMKCRCRRQHLANRECTVHSTESKTPVWQIRLRMLKACFVQQTNLMAKINLTVCSTALFFRSFLKCCFCWILFKVSECFYWNLTIERCSSIFLFLYRNLNFRLFSWKKTM